MVSPTNGNSNPFHLSLSISPIKSDLSAEPTLSDKIDVNDQPSSLILNQSFDFKNVSIKHITLPFNPSSKKLVEKTENQVKPLPNLLKLDDVIPISDPIAEYAPLNNEAFHVLMETKQENEQPSSRLFYEKMFNNFDISNIPDFFRNTVGDSLDNLKIDLFLNSVQFGEICSKSIENLDDSDSEKMPAFELKVRKLDSSAQNFFQNISAAYEKGTLILLGENESNTLEVSGAVLKTLQDKKFTVIFVDDQNQEIQRISSDKITFKAFTPERIHILCHAIFHMYTQHNEKLLKQKSLEEEQAASKEKLQNEQLMKHQLIHKKHTTNTIKGSSKTRASQKVDTKYSKTKLIQMMMKHQLELTIIKDEKKIEKIQRQREIKHQIIEKDIRRWATIQDIVKNESITYLEFTPVRIHLSKNHHVKIL